MKKAIFPIGFFSCVMILLAFVFPLDKVSAQKDRKIHVSPVTREEPVVAGRVLVKFRDNVGMDQARQIVSALGAREATTLPGIGVLVLELPEQANERGFAAALAAREDVEFAEPDQIVSPSDVRSNDPGSGNWKRNLTTIQAPAAWSTTTDDRNIIIAILDTGIDSSVPDLKDKLVPGWNIYNNNSNTGDVSGHGTMVATTAAAASTNVQSLASVTGNFRIMAIRISALDGTATFSAMASGLTWAADHGARVANLSYRVSTSPTVTAAANYFQNKGGVVVAAAGNQATFDGSRDNPTILTVSATDAHNVIASWSNTGNNIDLAAPGFVDTTYKGGGSTSGTSVASPMVAAAAAMVLSVNPNLSGAQVQSILKKSADDLGPAGWDPGYGWGRVNMARAVAAVTAAPIVDVTPPLADFISPTNGATVSGALPIAVTPSDNIGLSSVTLIIDGNTVGVDTSAPYTFAWNTVAVRNGVHSLTARAVDTSGNWNSVTIFVVANNVADSTAPTVNITSPKNGDKVTLNVPVTVNAADNVAVTKVELYVDGTLQAVSIAAPFTTKWNIAKFARGSHNLMCKVYDSAGNASESPLISVTK